MDFFRNFKVGTKIMAGYVIALVLTAVVGGVALVRLDDIGETVNDLAGNLAKDQHLADQIVEQICSITNNKDDNFKPFLGEIENLHSLVPMSQTTHTPIFILKAKDGVVGAHFKKVQEAEGVFSFIANNLLRNTGDIDD